MTHHMSPHGLLLLDKANANRRRSGMHPMTEDAALDALSNVRFMSDTDTVAFLSCYGAGPAGPAASEPAPASYAGSDNGAAQPV
ncbi:hypothetical protein [Ferrovibrio sp.]|uniref:hypothetical protein n=1 Tax=Ferrovibrio sp. TaxID=1917215 RepID=UPI00311E1529